MRVMQSVLNLYLVLLSLTLGMVGMSESRPDARTVMLGSIFCEPGNGSVVVFEFEFVVIVPSSVCPCGCNSWFTHTAVLNML